MALMGGIGYFGGNCLQVFKENVAKIEYVVITAFAILFAGWIVFKHFKTRGNLKCKAQGFWPAGMLAHAGNCSAPPDTSGFASRGCHSSPGLKAWGFVAYLINKMANH